MEAFMLGISTGAICVAYCAPVVVPYLLGEGCSAGRNFVLLAQFLAGRLVGYLLFGVLAWAISETVLRQSSYSVLGIGMSYLFFSILLIFYGFFKKHDSCSPKSADGFFYKLKTKWPVALPLIAGFITGLSFCPPFFLALTAAAIKGSLAQSMFFFFLFFLGTSIFFIPLPLTGLLHRYRVLQFIGKAAAGCVGAYYLYSGIIMLIGGFKTL
jgi:sulfite exporter TauE/SafE